MVVLTGVYATLIYDLPSPDILPTLIEPPNGTLLTPTQLFDRTGQHIILTLQNPDSEGRQYLPLSDTQSPRIPISLVNATIAIAEPNFWNDPGFSFTGLGRGSHPTLAQRLTAALLLQDESPSLQRSLRERLLAWQVTQDFGREKILEWYLNSAYYGRLSYGVDAASLLYFGKSASELDLSESALLAACAESPAINPLDAPQASLEGRNQVLKEMLLHGFITSDEYRQATQEATKISTDVNSATSQAPAFTNLALDQLEDMLGPDLVERGGLKITTSIDYDLQLQIACALDNQLSRIKGSLDDEIPAGDGSPCQAARLLPTFTSENQPTSDNFAANVILQDPTSGQILAMVGNPISKPDSVSFQGHPPGSIVTPFIYLTAFTRGYNPSSLIWDIPANVADPLVDIENPDGRFHGPIRLRIALANDYLVPAAQLLTQLGPQNVWRTAQQLGISSIEKLNPGEQIRLPFEGGNVTLLELSQAYSVFANQGILAGQESSPPQGETVSMNPITVLRIEDDHGEILLDCQHEELNCKFQSRPIISSQLAYLVTNILSDDTSRWSSMGHPNPLEVGRPAAAKIGQTIDGHDTWTVGYTPSLVAGVWIGKDSSSQSQPLSFNVAAGLWHAAIQYASRDVAVENWDRPAGITTLKVCDPSGMLPTPDCPVVVDEVFQTGSEPTQVDNLFRTFQVDRETGKLSTIFTPPELIEERIYMVVPPEAHAWASQAGLPIVPDSYDVIDITNETSPDASIDDPTMFSSVRGKVSISGVAKGDGFDFYRLQVGQGLDPKSWLQIGANIHAPVNNGLLARWDTSGLSGLYTLQLIVVKSDKSVLTTALQVTVDNQPPQVSVRYPEDEQRFKYPLDSTITFLADASDDLDLAAVKFYVDDQLVSTLEAPPFAVPWSARLGRHTLLIEAFDRAGNSAKSELSFIVER
jgi:membrane peptidoglycan carboxypeptidase